ARVAHVPYVGRAVPEGHAGERGAHAATALVLDGRRVDAPVREPDGLVDELVDAHHGLARPDLLDVPAEGLVEDLHGELAGDLARCRPTHAVSDGQQRDVPAVEGELPNAVVVLVERPDP